MTASPAAIPRPWVRRMAAFAGCLSLAYWLFGDTWARSAGFERPDVLRFAHFGSFEDYELWRSVLGAFHNANPEIEVRQEYVVGTLGQYETKLRQQRMAGAAPDVALIQHGSFAEFGKDAEDVGALISEELGSSSAGVSFDAGEYDAGAVAMYRWRGAQRGWPVCGGPLAIYLNLAALSRAELCAECLSPCRPTSGTWRASDLLRMP